ERSGRNGSGLPLLFRRVRAERRPVDAALHGCHRPVPQMDHLSVAPAQHAGDVEPHVWASVVRAIFVSLHCSAETDALGYIKHSRSPETKGAVAALRRPPAERCNMEE